MSKNVVMVTADSVRADHCGYVNPDSKLTGTLDRFASEGVNYTQAVAPGPRTPSSVPTMFTGRPCYDRTKKSDSLEERRERIARHNHQYELLSEKFKAHGYSTLAFTANPWTVRRTGFAAGFDEFVEVSANSKEFPSEMLSDSPMFRMIDRAVSSVGGDPFNWAAKKEWFSQWTGYYDLLKRKIEGLEEPYFVWVFLLDPHQPYFVPSQYRQESSLPSMYYSVLQYWRRDGVDLSPFVSSALRRAYRDSIRSTDAFLEQLWEDVAEDDPVLLFHSDHGEALGERNTFGHEPELYEYNLRVPLVLYNTCHTNTVADQLSLVRLPEILLDAALDEETFRPDKYTSQLAVARTEGGDYTALRTQSWKVTFGPDMEPLIESFGDSNKNAKLGQNSEILAQIQKLVTKLDSTSDEIDKIQNCIAEVKDEL